MNHLMLSSILLLSFAVRAESFADQEWVRVRLDHGLTQLEIHGRGLQVQGEEQVAQPVSIPSQKEEQLNITHVLKNGQWLWKVVILRPGQRNEIDTRIIGHPYMTILGSSIQRGTQALPNHLLLAGKKTFSLIAGEHLRDYLYGVVAKEMPIQWPLEALKAQTIAARSYAKAMMREHAHRPYQLESSILDQVYEKFDDQNFRNPKMEKVIRAVSETAGMILLGKDHQVLKAYYHADCGGKTSSSQSVFGTRGLEGGVVDSSCPLNPKAKWSYHISKENLSQRLKRFFHASDEFLGVSALTLKFLPQDERVSEVVVKIDDGETRAIKAQEFRDLLGFQDLRSTRFQMQQTSKEFVFSGTGFGHGVGLCQWGSRNLAQQGLKFQQILTHYYPGMALKAAENLYSKKADSADDHYVFD